MSSSRVDTLTRLKVSFISCNSCFETRRWGKKNFLGALCNSTSYGHGLSARTIWPYLGLLFISITMKPQTWFSKLPPKWPLLLLQSSLLLLKLVLKVVCKVIWMIFFSHTIGGKHFWAIWQTRDITNAIFQTHKYNLRCTSMHSYPCVGPRISYCWQCCMERKMLLKSTGPSLPQGI